MKIKRGFVMRDVAGQAVAIATGEASRNFHGMVKLNATGAAVWRGIEAGQSQQDIAESLATRFNIPIEQATADVDAFVSRMNDAGILEN